MRARFSRILALTAALSVFSGSLFAAPVEVPRVEAPVGSGVSAAPSVGAAVLAPALSAPVVPGLSAALPALPLAAAAAAPLAAAPAAVVAAPAAAAAPAPALAAVAASPVAGSTIRPGSSVPQAAERVPGVFGRRQEAPRDNAPSVTGEQEWTQSSALFDLSASRADNAVPDARTGLPPNNAGKLLLRLRGAAERGEEGPAAIPGMSRVEWTGLAGHGASGETTNILIGGKPWYLKRLGPSPDAVINATPPETRARNEVGMAAVLRGDPQLSGSFSVSPRVSVFRDGDHVYVLSEGLPTLGDGESRRQELSPAQRADSAIIQLVLGVGDMHGGDVLPLGGGRFGLVDFEKLSRAPLGKATPREIDEQIMLKNFPLVDRLSRNEPAVYRARFERWRKDYVDGGRARMDKTLAAAGWSRPQREVYLAAVDRNAETYLDRLEPYLEYGNGWFDRVTKARAEAARPKPEAKKGFLGGFFK